MDLNDLLNKLKLKELKTTKERVEIITNHFWQTYNTHNKKRNFREFVTWEEKDQRKQYVRDKLEDILKIGAKSWGKEKVTSEELQKYGFGGNYDTNDILELGFLPHSCTSACYIAFDLLDGCYVKVRILRGDLEGTEQDIPRKNKYAFNLNTHSVIEYYDDKEGKLIKFDSKWGAHPQFFKDGSGKLIKITYNKFRFEPWKESRIYYFVNNGQENESRYVNVRIVRSNFEEDTNSV